MTAMAVIEQRHDKLVIANAGAASSAPAGKITPQQWQDAIGVMIAKNMESRARNPGGSRGPSSRGRGGPLLQNLFA